MPVRFFVTSGTTADCTIAAQLIEGFQAEYLLADRGYDTDAIILKAADKGMTPVIPPKKNRKELREYDEYLYKLRQRLRILFFSNAGEASLHATPKMSLPSSLLSKFVVLLFSSFFIDDTI